MVPINGYHDTLLLLRARLSGEMNQMTDKALRNGDTVRMPSDMADVGTDVFEQEITLDLLGNENEVLEQIDAALKRIAIGRSGKCEGCGRAIAKARLDAIPYAALCVKWASRQEERRRHRRLRPRFDPRFDPRKNNGTENGRNHEIHETHEKSRGGNYGHG